MPQVRNTSPAGRAGSATTPLVPIERVGDRSMPPKDDTGTIQTSLRRALVRALTSSINDGVRFGDLVLVQIALATLAALAERPSRIQICRSWLRRGCGIRGGVGMTLRAIDGAAQAFFTYIDLRPIWPKPSMRQSMS